MLPTLQFGATGHASTRLIFGAAALGAMSQDRADQTLAQVHAAGINHIDTASGYGESEVRLAPWLSQHRNEVFLATKARTRQGTDTRAELEQSLTRLGVDHVDLIQLHNLVEPEEWEVAHGPGGAVEALQQAREEGLCRFIGVTGHGLRIAEMHLRSLERFPFDSVLVPFNYSLLQFPTYAADVERLRQRCAAENVAVQTIKSIARRRWPSTYEGKKFSWYEPLEDPAAITRAVQYVLGQPDLFLNTSSDARRLQAIVAAASGPISAPADPLMAHDQAEHQCAPLFDGAELERI